MNSNRQALKRWLWLASLVALSCIAVAASADEKAVERSGVLMAKDMGAGTVTVAGQVYTVTSKTEMQDHEGQAITLEDLEPVDVDSGLLSEGDVIHVEIRAIQVRESWRLLSLRLVAEAPS